MHPGMRWVLATGGLCLATLTVCQHEARPSELRDGDIIFQTSRSRQSQAIQLATHSRWSHMGLVHLSGGKPFVYEAVGPVKLTPLDAWIRRGEGSHYQVKRLKDAGAQLSPRNLKRMQSEAMKFRGRPYDLTFEWSDTRLYCSELVWKIYQRGLGIELARPARLGDADLSAPEVRSLMRQRYGSRLPLEEPVVSPQQIFDSPLLTTVVAQ